MFGPMPPPDLVDGLVLIEILETDHEKLNDALRCVLDSGTVYFTGKKFHLKVFEETCKTLRKGGYKFRIIPEK